MSFDRIDRAFRPKPRIELECVSCRGTKRVAMLYPLWPPSRGPAISLALCPACALLTEDPAKK